MTHTTASQDEDILDSLFHGCAFAAYVELAATLALGPQCQLLARFGMAAAALRE